MTVHTTLITDQAEAILREQYIQYAHQPAPPIQLSYADLQTINECADEEYQRTTHVGRRKALDRIMEACDNAIGDRFA